MSNEKTERGFSKYGTITDTKGSEVRLQESSAVGRRCCWIFCDNEDPSYKMSSISPAPHLSVENAKELIKNLQIFVEDAESPDNWRNDKEYEETFG